MPQESLDNTKHNGFLSIPKPVFVIETAVFTSMFMFYYDKSPKTVLEFLLA